MSDHYVLDANGDPREEPDFMAWAQWFEKADRRVALDQDGDVRVSTVFLGLDHNFSGGTPVLWETLVFGGIKDGLWNRYTSRQAALEGHAAILAEVMQRRAITFGDIKQE